MSDLVERLLKVARIYKPGWVYDTIMEGAAEIERLRGEIKWRDEWIGDAASTTDWETADEMLGGLMDARTEIKRLRGEIELLTNNKWSEIELALAQYEAKRLHSRLFCDECARLNKIIADAPHDQCCTSNGAELEECDCWKSRVIK